MYFSYEESTVICGYQRNNPHVSRRELATIMRDSLAYSEPEAVLLVESCINKLSAVPDHEYVTIDFSSNELTDEEV